MPSKRNLSETDAMRGLLTDWLVPFVGGVVLTLLLHWLASRLVDVPGYVTGLAFLCSVPIMQFVYGMRLSSGAGYGIGLFTGYASLVIAGVASLFVGVWKSVLIGLLPPPIFLLFLYVLQLMHNRKS